MLKDQKRKIKFKGIEENFKAPKNKEGSKYAPL